MKAIEIKSETDKNGYLKINYPLNKTKRKVRVIILLEEDSDQDEEKIWRYSVAKNPAFDFLQEPDEDIYTINDGEPFHD